MNVWCVQFNEVVRCDVLYLLYPPHAHIHTCTHSHMRTHLPPHDVCIHTLTHVLHITYTHSHAHDVQAHILPHVRIMYTHMHTCTHLHPHDVHTYTHTCTHIHAFTYTHIHTRMMYTYTPKCGVSYTYSHINSLIGNRTILRCRCYTKATLFI